MMPASEEQRAAIEKFLFRDIHQRIFVGTASDRYAGWLGQIYSAELYENRLSRRTKKVAGEQLIEETLPIESVREYFKHFKVLEIDYTFYSFLLDAHGEPTRIFRTLLEYKKYMDGKGQVLLKVPQSIFARRLLRGRDFTVNREYLKFDAFVRRFYEPATDILGDSLKGFIFEQEYQRKRERVPLDQLVKEFDLFFRNIPDDPRYHVELRTAEYLCDPVFEVFEKYGIGQVLSHWTWLPEIRVQMRAAKGRFFNSGHNCVIRLMTPRGVRYEDAYKKAYPFNKLVEDMISQNMIDDTVEIMKKGIANDVNVNVIVNNRAGGNAPMIARMIAKKFLSLN